MLSLYIFFHNSVGHEILNIVNIFLHYPVGIMASPLLLLGFIMLAYSLARIKTEEILVGRSGFFPFFLKILPGHMVIYGRTGSGKSNTAKLIASMLSKRIPVLILDWAGEYDLDNFEKLVPGENFQINPLEYISGDLSEHIDFLVDLFGDVFQFSDPMKFMFRRTLNQLFKDMRAPTLVQLLEKLDAIPLKSYYDHETKMAIKRRLAHLIEGRALRTFVGSSHSLGHLFSTNIVIDLSVFRSVHIKILFTLILLKMLYDYVVSRKRFSRKVKHVVIVEEAYNVIPYRRLNYLPSIGERLFAELRKYGECVIAVSQSPVETSWSLAKNARIVIIHNVLDKDVDSIFGIKANPPFSKLSTGEAYVIQDNKTRHVKFFKYKNKKSRREITKISRIKFFHVLSFERKNHDSYIEIE